MKLHEPGLYEPTRAIYAIAPSSRLWPPNAGVKPLRTGLGRSVAIQPVIDGPAAGKEVPELDHVALRVLDVE